MKDASAMSNRRAMTWHSNAQMTSCDAVRRYQLIYVLSDAHSIELVISSDDN